VRVADPLLYLGVFLAILVGGLLAIDRLVEHSKTHPWAFLPLGALVIAGLIVFLRRSGQRRRQAKAAFDAISVSPRVSVVRTRTWRTAHGTLLVERPAGKWAGHCLDINGAKIDQLSIYFEVDGAGTVVTCHRPSVCPLDDYLYSTAFGVASSTLYKYFTSWHGPRNEVESEATVLLTDLVPVAENQLSRSMRAAVEGRERQFREQNARPGWSWTWWAG
jgi:hypothetical protein